MVGSRRPKEKQGEDRVQEGKRKESFRKDKAVSSDKHCRETREEGEKEGGSMLARGPQVTGSSVGAHSIES